MADSAERRSAPARVRIQDVAQAAGVSRSTTSRALNGSGYVAESARRRVLLAAEELGYLPDMAARSVKQGRGTSIGLLVTHLGSPLHSEIAVGVSERLLESPYTLMAAHTTSEVERQLETARAFAARRVEGMILTPLGERTSEYLEQLGVPVVEVDGQPSARECDRVLPDAAEAGRALARHVRERGAERVVAVIEDPATASQLAFVDGCEDVLGTAGTAVRRGAGLLQVRTTEILDETRVGGPASDAGRGGGRPGPTAYLAGTPWIAEQLWSARLGRSGDDLLASFGDAPWMSLVVPAVTAVRHDAARLGRRAAERLLERLAEPDAPFHHDLLPVELLVRATTDPRP